MENSNKEAFGRDDIRDLLCGLKEGRVSIEEAELFIRKKPLIDLGYANIDTQRGIRTGVKEVIYGAGKSAAQIKGIVEAMKEAGQENILITRLSPEKASEIRKELSFDYYEDAKA
ncbi:MAG: 1-(5-phosphoribosyl)-5-amino-4-imidazole-carboxylate carboxylase, partial [Lachnospiraceae bacterium]|nr:1-(5-phosphoribosyl)-5-amino-4-imidazole-carboxylate carboxylase [Lachnospiraceae bacterium]